MMSGITPGLFDLSFARVDLYERASKMSKKVPLGLCRQCLGMRSHSRVALAMLGAPALLLTLLPYQRSQCFCTLQSSLLKILRLLEKSRKF